MCAKLENEGSPLGLDPYLTAEACRAKALDCARRADALDDPAQKAAMLQYSEWWTRLAAYRDDAGLRALDPDLT
jgi:hypothetical protein